jgi:hypothetical protein
VRIDGQDEGAKAVAAGMNPMDLKRGVERWSPP